MQSLQQILLFFTNPHDGKKLPSRPLLAQCCQQCIVDYRATFQHCMGGRAKSGKSFKYDCSKMNVKSADVRNISQFTEAYFVFYTDGKRSQTLPHLKMKAQNYNCKVSFVNCCPRFPMFSTRHPSLSFLFCFNQLYSPFCIPFLIPPPPAQFDA